MEFQASGFTPAFVDIWKVNHQMKESCLNNSAFQIFKTFSISFYLKGREIRGIWASSLARKCIIGCGQPKWRLHCCAAMATPRIFNLQL